VVLSSPRPEAAAWLANAQRCLHARFRGLAVNGVFSFCRYTLWCAVAAALSACGGAGPADSSPPVTVVTSPHQAAAARRPIPDMRHMRAVHMTSNWGGNQQGFQPPLLSGAAAISAAQVKVYGSLSSYVAGGVQHTNDLAIVELDGVQLGTASFTKAGFMVFRDLASGTVGIQFKASDPNLSGISGLSGDVNLQLQAGSQFLAVDGIAGATGDALLLVKSVLAHAPELVASAQATLDAGATLAQPAALSSVLATLRASMDWQDAAFFAHLKSMNVEWIGISVPIHYDSFSDPIVRRHDCSGYYQDAAGVLTPCSFSDANLLTFIGRARAQGLKIYMTLAFEASWDIDNPSSATCHTAGYKMPRWWLGAPKLPDWAVSSQCIAPGDWWWNPSHPDYATKTQAFWDSYKQVAVGVARLAETAGVDLFSLGTETENLFRTRSGTGDYTNNFRAPLQAMTDAVRAVYGGAITYDQHFQVWDMPEQYGGGAGNFDLFNDLGLDVVGISAYFPLVSTPPNRIMQVSELESGWEDVFQRALVPMRNRYPSKPIVFTEVGYVDDINAPYDQQSNAGAPKPAHDPGTATPGQQQQANIYQAFFNTNARHADLVAGTFWWGNEYFPYNLGVCGNVDWGLYCNAPARDAVASAYAQWRRQDAQRVFAWARSVYPALFAGNISAGSYLNYYFQYYGGSTTYLGLDENEGTVTVHNGRDFNFYKVGPMRPYLDLAAEAGF
jgi:hypothetical protein